MGGCRAWAPGRHPAGKALGETPPHVWSLCTPESPGKRTPQVSPASGCRVLSSLPLTQLGRGGGPAMTRAGAAGQAVEHGSRSEGLGVGSGAERGGAIEGGWSHRRCLSARSKEARNIGCWLKGRWAEGPRGRAEEGRKEGCGGGGATTGRCGVGGSGGPGWQGCTERALSTGR